MAFFTKCHQHIFQKPCFCVFLCAFAPVEISPNIIQYHNSWSLGSSVDLLLSISINSEASRTGPGSPRCPGLLFSCFHHRGLPYVAIRWHDPVWTHQHGWRMPKPPKHPQMARSLYIIIIIYNYAISIYITWPKGTQIWLVSTSHLQMLSWSFPFPLIGGCLSQRTSSIAA